MLKEPPYLETLVKALDGLDWFGASKLRLTRSRTPARTSPRQVPAASP